ncbi:MAG: c-type cytochrome, partial [Candidatus Promineifilaceae bacterium]
MISKQIFSNARRLGRRFAAVLLVLFAVPLLMMVPFGTSAQEPLEPDTLPDAGSGLALYDARCANCHGPSGQGDGELAGNLPAPPRDFSDEAFRRTAVPSSHFQTITDGRLEGAMPPFGPASSNPIDEESRWDLVAAVISLGTPAEAVERGQVVYEENCLACHGEDGKGDDPEAANSSSTVIDLTDLRYWYNRSNEMVLASLEGNSISDHTYELEQDQLWDV